MNHLKGALAARLTQRYATALVTVVVAYIVRYTLVQRLGFSMPPFITFYPAVMLVAVLGGLGPGLLSTALCALVSEFLIFPLPHSLKIVASDRLALGLFTTMGVLISVLADYNRRNRQTIASYGEQQASWLVNAKLELALASTPDAIFITDLKGEFIHFNEGFAVFHRFRDKAECFRRAADFYSVLEVYNSAGELVPLDGWAAPRALRGEIGKQVEVRHRRRDTGETWMASYNYAPIRDNHGAITGSVVVARDVTESKRAEANLRRLNRVYAVLSAINEALVRQNDSRTMLQNACSIAVEKGNFRMAWVGMPNEKTGFLEPVASAGPSEGYLKQAVIDFRNPARATGPAARAFHTGQRVVCGDINHEFYRPWKKFAISLGYRSIASFPLTIEGRVKGVFNLYSSEIGFFDEEELRLLEEMAMDISFALEVNQLEERRQTAEENLQTRERQLSIMYESMHDMLMYLAVEAEDTYRFVSVNSAFVETTGLQREQVVGKLVKEVMPEPAAGKMREGFRKAVQGRKTVQWTGSTIFPAGESYAEIFASPVIDARGICTHLVCMAHDITDRRNVEQDLRRRTALFEAQVDSSLDGVLVDDPQGKAILHNRRFAEMWRLPQCIMEDPDDDAQRRYVDALVKHPAQFRAKVDYLNAHSDEISYDEIETADGRCFDRYTFPVRDKAGNYYGRTWTFRDVTERKQVEQDLRRRTALFEAQVDSSLDGVLVVDPHGQKILHNQRFAEMWRLPQWVMEDPDDDAQRRYVNALVKSPAQFQAKVDYLNAHSDEISNDEIEMVDGRCFDRYTSPVRDKAGNYYGRTWTFRDITEHKKAGKSIEQLNRVYRVLSDTNQTIMREKESRAVLETVCRIAVEKGGFLMAWLGMIDQAAQTIEPLCACGQVEGYLEQFKLDLCSEKHDRGPAVRCALSGEHAVCDDIASDPGFAHWRSAALARGFHSVACFPLKSEGEVCGVLCLYSGETGFFTDGELALIDEMAMNISFALEVSYHEEERMQLEADTTAHLRELQVLGEMNKALLAVNSEKELLQEYCRIAVETAGYRMAWVGFAEQTPEKFVAPVAWAGHEDGYLSAIKTTWDGGEFSQGVIGRALLSRQIQVAQDAAAPGSTIFVAEARKRGYHAAIAIPFETDPGAMACLTVYSAASIHWMGTERHLMQQVASALGYGIRTLRGTIARDRYFGDLRDSLEHSIQLIVETLDRRDPYTAGHQRRVADLSVHIALALGMEPERIRGLRLAATIHDLGKIGIPAEILSKPGRLSPAEFALVKEHSQIGYEILKDVTFPWPIAEMIFQHHERFDGSGYPCGLAGDSILIEARILAVADSLEAVAAHRPYRASLGVEFAVSEILKGRGTLYDVSVVDACARIFREGGYTLVE
jgi:PAS domain S-box-containing protein